MKTIVIHRVTSSKFGNRMKYTKEKQDLIIQVFLISSVTVSLISFYQLIFKLFH